jgi:hypothetical protein
VNEKSDRNFILFLDDDPIRAVMAYERMSQEDRDKTIWCKTVQEAIQTLWDYRDVLTKVMMEHDLNGEDYVNIKRDDVGMEVVRFIENIYKSNMNEFLKFRKIKFVIHTWNSVAGIKMTQRLAALYLDAHYIPFGMTGEMKYGRV